MVWTSRPCCARRSPDGLFAGRGSYSRHAMAGAGREERAWVRGAQAGSASDLEALFRHHWPGAYRAAYLVVHDAAAAEDIAQEAFLSAVRALDSFDRRRPFGPWLHRIVVNRAIDWTRARALRREVGDEQLAVTPSRPEPPPDDLSNEIMAALGRALARPPGSRRACATSSTTRPARSPSCSSCRAAPSTRASGAAWTPCRSA